MLYIAIQIDERLSEMGPYYGVFNECVRDGDQTVAVGLLLAMKLRAIMDLSHYEEAQ